MIGYLENSALESVREKLRSSSGIVIFGAGCVGTEAVYACFEAGIKVLAICDNSPEKIGSSLLGIPVISLKKAIAKYPYAECMIAVAHPEQVRGMLSQANAIGFINCYGAQIIKPSFIFRETPTYKNGGFLKWDAVNKAVWCHDSLHHTAAGRLVLPKISCFITDRCTLRCRDCSIFVPYCQSPTNYSTDEIIREIDILCANVDEIWSFIVLGGEAFLHPDFAKIVNHAIGKNNIFQVWIITNATLMPKEECWAALCNDKVFFSLSDYGPLSSRRDSLVNALEEWKIKGVIVPAQSWQRNRLVDGANVPEDELQAIFSRCKWKDCYSMAGGKMTLCAPALYGMKLGRIAEHSSNFIDLFQTTVQGMSLRSRIKEYLQHTEFLNACGYCEAWRSATPIQVNPAEQVNRDSSCKENTEERTDTCFTINS